MTTCFQSLLCGKPGAKRKASLPWQILWRCSVNSGVPSFRYGAVNYWGQDRLWFIDEAIKKRVESSSTQGVSNPTATTEVTQSQRSN